MVPRDFAQEVRRGGCVDSPERVCYYRALNKMTKAGKRRAAAGGRTASLPSNTLKRKGVTASSGLSRREKEMTDPRVREQQKLYEEAMRHFQEQKFHKAKQALEKVLEGPSRELVDRAQVHLRICERRISKPPDSAPRTAEEHYHHGVAMMNLGRWEDSRQALERARKIAPKADYIIYALAALDSLTGEVESAMTHLKLAIELRPENRYHARNDQDFAYLLEDPRFTELLYPERDGPLS
jgi:tetratricopeptide (TPR) repeat protein